jgi:hypothetical protein
MDIKGGQVISHQWPKGKNRHGSAREPFVEMMN